MNDMTVLSTEAVVQQRDALVGRLLQDAAGTFRIFAM
jgi:hypothetical protein